MKKIILSAVTAVIFSNAWAAGILPSQAERVATRFLSERNAALVHPADRIYQAATARAVGDEFTFYYIVEMETGGYVLVSGTDLVVPVLAYSFDGSFGTQGQLPCNVGSWMENCKAQIRHAVLSSEPVAPEITHEWKRLLSDASQQDPKALNSVEPLLVSKWNQPWPYNGMCPADPAGSNGHCVTGCVATAMGQLLYYYRFPLQGLGSYSYIHPVYGEISANFDTTHYDWNGMPTSISAQNDPIALLLFHQGVSVDMDYGPSSSGMWNHKAAYSLKNHFRYGPETQYYFRDSITLDWDSILVANLDQRKPLYYAGWAGVQSTSGHAFVCDGYQGSNYFHFNWGWGGSYDGYFYTDNLAPGGNDFNYAQEVIPMFPDTLQNTYPDYCAGTTILHTLRGSVEDGSGWYPYQAGAGCSWLIDPQDPEVDSVSRIKISFKTFDTEEGQDIVRIYDGETTAAPLLGTYSGSSLPAAITSSGNKVLITFETNGTVSKNGWLADYESIIPVYCNALTTMTDASGTLGDGSGDHNYNNGTNCKWRIQPPGAALVTLTFTSFETADSSDFVKVVDLGTSAVIGEFWGSQIPPVISGSGKLMVFFLTNSHGNAAGWEASYTSSLTGGDNPVDADACLKVYPNPADDVLWIESNIPGNEPMDIFLTDLTGRVIFRKTLNPSPGSMVSRLDLPGIQGETFFVVARTCKGIRVQKVIKR